MNGQKCPIFLRILTEMVVFLTIGHFKYPYYTVCCLYQHLQAGLHKLVVPAIILNTLWKALELTVFIRKVQGRYVDLPI